MNNVLKVLLDNAIIIVKIMNMMYENKHIVHYTLIERDFQQ
jgi:hypothetical protein